MNNFEELEIRKRELQLKSDIAKLERSERIRNASSAASWSWLWVGPLGLLGCFLIIAVLTGFNDSGFTGVIGAIALAPMAIKFFSSNS